MEAMFRRGQPSACKDIAPAPAPHVVEVIERGQKRQLKMDSKGVTCSTANISNSTEQKVIWEFAWNRLLAMSLPYRLMQPPTEPSTGCAASPNQVAQRTKELVLHVHRAPHAHYHGNSSDVEEMVVNYWIHAISNEERAETVKSKHESLLVSN
jgi:hypothetical protein